MPTEDMTVSWYRKQSILSMTSKVSICLSYSRPVTPSLRIGVKLPTPEPDPDEPDAKPEEQISGPKKLNDKCKEE